MKSETAIGMIALLMTSADPVAQGPGALVGRVQAKQAAVVFLEEFGQEQFGLSRGKTEPVRATLTDAPRVALDQEKKTFVPHVLAIERGSVVEFVNSDDLLHNIHLYRGTDMKTLLNVAMPIKRMRLSYRFDVPDEVVVLCDIHSEMSAYILVLPNKHFIKIERSGEFEIKGINPGRYMLKVWREGMKKLEQTTVEIKPGMNTLRLGK